MEALINMVPAQMQPVLDYLQLKQLKAVLEITLQSHAESSVPSRCDTTSNYWLGFNSFQPDFFILHKTPLTENGRSYIQTIWSNLDVFRSVC